MGGGGEKVGGGGGGGRGEELCGLGKETVGAGGKYPPTEVWITAKPISHRSESLQQ